ncbi:hypothetical protein [Agromyces sp. NPDC058126]|uniref:hypothetical protein n=1 Tax=Agromyces sp. NPDC058126 TaxID=3346350 RepID=UPI0036DB0363
MSTETWSDADDASVAFESIPPEHPVKLTAAVYAALTALDQSHEFLRLVVTPESLPAWGDFTAAARALEAQYGINSVARSYPSAPDVAYVWLMEYSPDARMITTPETVVVPHTFTWIWRPELGGWKLHSIGAGDAPEVLPRTSPGTAPDIGAIPPHLLG